MLVERAPACRTADWPVDTGRVPDRRLPRKSRAGCPMIRWAAYQSPCRWPIWTLGACCLGLRRGAAFFSARTAP